jgi:hypothetical protein
MGRLWSGWVVLDGEGLLIRFTIERPDSEDVLRMMKLGWRVIPAELQTTPKGHSR